jgi:hypothetical protein
LLECRRHGLDAALLAALQKEPGYLLDKQRHAPGALSYTIDDFLGQSVSGCERTNHVLHLMTT